MRWFIVALVFVLFLAACGESDATRPVTIDARDPVTRLLIEPVNVRKDYQNRNAGVVGRTHDGAAVQFVQRVGDGAVALRLPVGATLTATWDAPSRRKRHGQWSSPLHPTVRIYHSTPTPLAIYLL